MNQFEAALSALSYQQGRALRTASQRHRRLIADPLGIVLFQLGAEPFSAAAIAYGCRQSDLTITVAGEPRNRDLAFAALLEFARIFNDYFEAPARSRQAIVRGSYTISRALSLPQVIVANGASVELLQRIGRRLAYLPMTGEHAADPTLVRLGRHLSFLTSYADTPGQQLLLSMTTLLNSHWITPQSETERQSLFALDAFIEPPAGVNGFYAAAEAERYSAGPVPNGDDDSRLGPIMEDFNTQRGNCTEPAVVQPLLYLIEAHYNPLIDAAWELLWRCRERELGYPEAPSVQRRFEKDLEAYTAHIDWTNSIGLRRTRQTARQAAMTLRSLEDATQRLQAEEACDDPLKMAPCLLEHKALLGDVINVDTHHTELANVRRVRRPLVTLLSKEPCLIPVGKELFWSERPITPWVLEAVEPLPSGGAKVTLKYSSSNLSELPQLKTKACFSIHTTAERWQTGLPSAVPWTHQGADMTLPSIEE